MSASRQSSIEPYAASIIIPTYNRHYLLKACVEAIRAHTTPPYEIIVVDNGSTDGTVQYCREEHLSFVSLAHNRGFPAACNIGMTLGSGHIVILLNNDVIVSYRWLDNILEAFKQNEDVGIIGPTTNYASGKQLVHREYGDLEQFHRLTRQWNELDPKKHQRVQRVVGLCLAIRRSVIRDIGLLDERFSPGHFEDDDYCLRARMSGYGIMICGDVFVHHYGSASFKEHGEHALTELIQRNYARFIEKWSIDPHHFI
ncbi:glycosyltransferase family 2 protein [Paenibacillus sp. 1001270B_150601_E10]|uniref:glycosyltransferase family 2 protein n=1 Tax=Paenibacillus sp. 1001270B_150601_E10 TaxID=2787079 RepID=UPI00189F1FB4|nr:glycosyltransferase family 2 protein [Paenibacillus sp. 1001270B_150601_E10]